MAAALTASFFRGGGGYLLDRLIGKESQLGAHGETVDRTRSRVPNGLAMGLVLF
jgi:hypothetical protein